MKGQPRIGNHSGKRPGSGAPAMDRRGFVRRLAYAAPVITSYLLHGRARAGVALGSPPDPPGFLKYAADREGRLPGK